MYSTSYEYSSVYSSPYLYPHKKTITYTDLFKELCQKVAALLPYAVAPIGLYGAYKLLCYLIPGPHHQSKLKLTDKTVLIIGASTGLGRTLAFEFYAKGAKVILAARSIDKLEALCHELVQWGKQNGVKNPYNPSFRYLDITELNGGDDGLTQIRELTTYAIDEKTIDVLINCAGLSSRGSIQETPLYVHRRLMDVNFFGYVAITKALLDHIPDDGAILNINSVQGRVALPYRSPYSCSKHAIQAFFDSLRGERPKLQILTVNAGYINTGFATRALDPQGNPTGREDPNQLRGMSPEQAAKRIVNSLENRELEIVLAPFKIRAVIFLRLFTPNLLWWFLRRKAAKELEEAKQAQKTTTSDEAGKQQKQD